MAQVANGDVLADVQLEIALRVVNTKAPSIAGAQMILSSTRRLTCSSTG